MTISDLSPDPTDTTHALLQNIWLSVNHTSGAAPSAVSIPAWKGPPASVIWVQCLLYTSLACSLFAALGAVLGKQWLNRYSSVDEHGSLEERCKRRHRKFASMEEWHFRRVLEALPVLLQLSLLLFGLALSAFMFTRQLAVAIVLTVANLIGATFYFTVVAQSVRFDDSPFQTPLSDVLRRTPTYAARLRKIISRCWQDSSVRMRAVEWGSKISSSGTRYRREVMGAVTRLGHSLATATSFVTNLVRPMGPAVQSLVHAASGTTTSDRDPENALTLGSLPPNLDIDDTAPSSAPHPKSSIRVVREALGRGLTYLTRLLPKRGTRSTYVDPRVGTTSEADVVRDTAVAVLWLLDATSDPLVREDVLQAVHLMEWPLDLRKELCTPERLDFLTQQLVACFQVEADGEVFLTKIHERRAADLSAAFLFLYWEFRIFDWTPSRKSWSNMRFLADRTHIIVKALQAYKNIDLGDGPVLYLTCLTFQMDSLQMGRQRNPRPKRCTNTSTSSTESLCTQTLFFLAHVSDGFAVQQDIDVLGAIASHCTRGTLKETAVVSLIATTVLVCRERYPELCFGDV